MYAEPFRAAIAEAGLATVMNSYASVDGVAVRRVEGDPRRPAARRARLHRRGRRRLLHDRAADQRTTTSRRRTAKPGKRALEAGLDMELPQLDCYGAPLQGADRGGRGRRRARRPLGAARARAEGARSACSSSRTSTKTRADAAYGQPRPRRARARGGGEVDRAAAERRRGAAAARPDARVAVIGPAADDERLLQGDYSYPAHTEIVRHASATTGILPQAGGDFAPGPYYPEVVTPLAGYRARFDRRHVREGLRASRGHEPPSFDAVDRRSCATPTSSSCFVGGELAACCPTARAASSAT